MLAGSCSKASSASDRMTLDFHRFQIGQGCAPSHSYLTCLPSFSWPAPVRPPWHLSLLCCLCHFSSPVSFPGCSSSTASLGPSPSSPCNCQLSQDSHAVMSQWSGENWTLRANQNDESDPQRTVTKDTDTDDDIRAYGHKETVVHHSGPSSRPLPASNETVPLLGIL